MEIKTQNENINNHNMKILNFIISTISIFWKQQQQKLRIAAYTTNVTYLINETTIHFFIKIVHQ
jgi:hypothetical protein